MGAPALRQGVVLLPRGEGVPVRAVVDVGGFEGEVGRTVIEVDDESMWFFFLFSLLLSIFFFSEIFNLCGT